MPGGVGGADTHGGEDAGGRLSGAGAGRATAGGDARHIQPHEHALDFDALEQETGMVRQALVRDDR